MEDPTMDSPLIKRLRKFFPKKSRRDLHNNYRFMLADDSRDFTTEQFIAGIKQLRNFDGSLSDEDIRQVFVLLERNDRITSEEFIPAIRGRMNPFRQSVVEFIFKRLDKANAGFIKDTDLFIFFKDCTLPEIILKTITPRAKANDLVQQVHRAAKGERADREKCTRFSLDQFSEYYLDKSNLLGPKDDRRFMMESLQEWNFKVADCEAYVEEARLKLEQSKRPRTPPPSQRPASAPTEPKPSVESPRAQKGLGSQSSDSSPQLESAPACSAGKIQHGQDEQKMSISTLKDSAAAPKQKAVSGKSPGMDPSLQAWEQQMNAVPLQEKRRMRQKQRALFQQEKDQDTQDDQQLRGSMMSVGLVSADAVSSPSIRIAAAAAALAVVTKSEESSAEKNLAGYEQRSVDENVRYISNQAQSFEGGVAMSSGFYAAAAAAAASSSAEGAAKTAVGGSTAGSGAVSMSLFGDYNTEISNDLAAPVVSAPAPIAAVPAAALVMGIDGVTPLPTDVVSLQGMVLQLQQTVRDQAAYMQDQQYTIGELYSRLQYAYSLFPQTQEQNSEQTQ